MLKGERVSDVFSGGLWLVIDVGLVAILGAALAYGIARVGRISARKRRQTDQATRELYDHER